MHDLEVVTVLDADVLQHRARNDFKIPLDSHAERIKTKTVDHLSNAYSSRNASMFAIDPDCEAAV
jgi:hypothetical protein